MFDALLVYFYTVELFFVISELSANLRCYLFKYIFNTSYPAQDINIFFSHIFIPVPRWPSLPIKLTHRC